MSVAVSIRHLKKSFAGQPIFQDLSFDLAPGKITAIVGPNGSGKSTLLHILSGLARADGGEIRRDGFDPKRFSYIFQQYRESLLPWRTIRENMLFPLQLQGRSASDMEERLNEVKEWVNWTVDAQRYPHQLSGGQQQILAFVRALMTHPTLLFIDEPFSALDYEHNLRLRLCLQNYYLRYQPTILLITHHVEEAAHLAQRIVIFTQRPTFVFTTIENPLPYPRTIETLKTPAMHAMKDRVLSAFAQIAHVS